MAHRRRVVITGIGLVSPCGIGAAPTWAALLRGQSGIGPIESFDASQCETRFGGEIRNFDPADFMDRKQARRMAKFQQYAQSAAEMAMRDAALTVPPSESERAGALIGSGVAGLTDVDAEHRKALQHGPKSVSPFFILQILGNMAPAFIAIRYGLKGPNWSPNSACATSAHAIGEAFRYIQLDEADIMLAGGAEAGISMMGVAGFNAIRALSTRNDDPQGASRPFDRERDGFVMSDGAAVLVLEELNHARDRGAQIYAELMGYGSTADANHITAPAPRHEGGQRAMRMALRDARLQPCDVDHINAHATATPVGDPLEIEAIKEVFGEHAYRMPISATKSTIGHMLGAAGAAELAIAALTLRDQVVPPTINLNCPDAAIDLDCVPNVAREAELKVIMSNSFGFGGTNATLVIGALEESLSR